VKKVNLSLSFLLFTFCLHAQDLKDKIPENSFLAFYLRFTALFVLFALAGYFIITIIQQFMNYQLRKKIIEHNIAESLAEQLLSPAKEDRKKEAVKWMLLTGALALGVLIASFIQPYGAYSVVIILLSLVTGLFFYYLYVKRFND
jgi:hypothetical protein